MSDLILTANKDFVTKFQKNNQVEEYIEKFSHSCPCCIIDNPSGRSKRFRGLYNLRCHVTEQHRGFDHADSGLTYDDVLELIDQAKTILFWRIIS